MKKWFKECPFCANEIREEAIKCQYCHEFLNEKKENKDEVNWAASFWWFSVEDQIKNAMEQKDNETTFQTLLKWFDYVWWIILIRCIIIVFKWYSIAPWWRRFIMWCYLIFWIYSVWKSICNNVKVAKNTNILFRTIFKVKDMIRDNKNKDEILDELDFSKILKSFHR